MKNKDNRPLGDAQFGRLYGGIATRRFFNVAKTMIKAAYQDRVRGLPYCKAVIPRSF